MYKIFADNILIYDSTIEDYKIGKGSINLEPNKSGSFEFSVYPDHFYYDQFVRLKTVIKVVKGSKIVFRGRILNDVTDYWNNKVITCEGELGFLQDSIIRPFEFTGTPTALFKKFVNEHNNQVDDFKKFKIGTVTVTDPNNYINRSNSGYESALSNLNSRLIEDSLGGYFYITHENEEDTPTLNYLDDFTKVATQVIEFGSNLKNYTKTVKADEIATAIIPLGATVDDGNSDTEDPKLTIASVNDGVDYVYDESAVALRGWIFKTVEWIDVTNASNLKSKAEAYLKSVINQSITIELNAIDLHLLDRSIESFNVCEYIRIVSPPHNFDDTLLCTKQTIDLLKPENDSITLGYTYSSFTERSSKAFNTVTGVNKLQSAVNSVSGKVTALNGQLSNFATNEQLEEYATTEYLKQYVADTVTPFDILGYVPSRIKMRLNTDQTNYSTSYNNFHPFSGAVTVTAVTGNLSQSTKVITYNDRVNQTVKGILIGKDINAIHYDIGVRYLNNDTNTVAVQTYLLYVDGSTGEITTMNTASNTIGNARLTQRMTGIISSLKEGDFITVMSYKGNASRDIDVMVNYCATHMDVYAIG